MRIAANRPLTAARQIREIDFGASSVEVARRLIGWILLVDGVGGVIVETEAYDQSEPASHGFIGKTPRNGTLFGPPGHAYVYLSYGIHWCLNVVCRERGHAAGVLIRALEPTAGLERMRGRRGLRNIALLCSGPGRLGQALAVTPALDGRCLSHSPFRLYQSIDDPLVVKGPRIGIKKAVWRPWRFGLQGSPWLSRPFVGPAAPAARG
jgi:DNA-3-methyladenine glycosylase